MNLPREPSFPRSPMDELHGQEDLWTAHGLPRSARPLGHRVLFCTRVREMTRKKCSFPGQTLGAGRLSGLVRSGLGCPGPREAGTHSPPRQRDVLVRDESPGTRTLAPPPVARGPLVQPQHVPALKA